MRFISLFSGIGGFDLGLERAGWRCVAQVEIDEYARGVLDRHWPDVPKWRDIHEVGPEDLPEADAVVGGFPCQPFSLAGRRRGASDPRNLWPEMRRIVEDVRPRWVLAENVAGIINTYLDAVADDLEAMDYAVGAFALPAAAFGAPHIRERLFIVAHAEGFRCEWREALPPAPIQEWLARLERDNPWTAEPGVDRVAYGVSNRVDRIRALGNAVVPQVAEFIGRLILEVDRRTGG